MRTRLALFALTALFSASPAGASAQLNQPDGTAVPQTSDLQDLFTSRSDPVSAYTDGAVMPETFVPDCSIDFEVLMRDAGFLNVFGWYNATGTRPPTSELYLLLGPDDGPGSRATLDIRGDPRYLGGEIGFWMKTPEGCPDARADVSRGCGYLYFSERRYNDDGAGGVDSWIHLITYDSRSDPATFYFAWEDLFRGGDNDFSDIVTVVSRITCAGAGGECDTGMSGVCAYGTQQCRSGALTCVGARGPGTETCNGLDDNCDGMTDEGDLCPVGELCRFGRCTPECGGLEFVCSADETCIDAVCVENDCVDVSCAAGEICGGGVCRAACDGVVCPAGRSCLFGACVDPCDGVVCDAAQVCEGGVCRNHCDCRACDTGLACDSASGRCGDPACAAISCEAGFYCEGGTCRDACAPAVCPPGQVCQVGECVEAPRVDGGVAGFDAGTSARDGGMTGGRDAGPRTMLTSGCCHVAGGTSEVPPGSWLIGGLLALLTLRRRRA